ncbi:hypothetical protein CDD83_8160 [Cordyceps sp. RAO-2017]|nr:hypothetical protein CDD83_8160 [Cordyceps sp. RAO-2017]
MQQSGKGDRRRTWTKKQTVKRLAKSNAGAKRLAEATPAKRPVRSRLSPNRPATPTRDRQPRFGILCFLHSASSPTESVPPTVGVRPQLPSLPGRPATLVPPRLPSPPLPPSAARPPCAGMTPICHPPALLPFPAASSQRRPSQTPRRLCHAPRPLGPAYSRGKGGGASPRRARPPHALFLAAP